VARRLAGQSGAASDRAGICRGCEVTKVNFNSGDDLYFRGPEVVRFTGASDAWPDFLEQLIRDRGIQAIVLFGDCRPLHRAAIARARAIDCPVFVFEEGYLRPDFVTLERDGVNGYSKVPKDPGFYNGIEPRLLPAPAACQHAFLKSALHTVCYATAARVFGFRYPLYEHHRDIRPLHQGVLWAKSGWLRVLRGVRDRPIDERLQRGELSPFFLVPLQVHLDSQMEHSDYETIDEFIVEVTTSFAAHAPSDSRLVLKHHPMDRPYRDYTRLVAELRARFDLGERLLYVDVLRLPPTLRKASGTVVINSTLGLSSIHHGTPVKCLGRAVYDVQGLTFQGTLDEFWRDPGSVDRALYERFRYWLRTNNQLNGCVWSDLCP
jgi:capsule polysaccharide modification protein KpsS